MCNTLRRDAKIISDLDSGLSRSVIEAKQEAKEQQEEEVEEQVAARSSLPRTSSPRVSYCSPRSTDFAT